MAETKLLLDEYPLIILPRLAVAIGLNEAIVLQQIHYWLRSYETAEGDRPEDERPHFRDGRWWVYNTVEEWQEQFPFWSYRTVRRALERLRAPGSGEGTVERGPLLIATSAYNTAGFDRTLWYSVDYVEVERLERLLGQMHLSKMDKSSGPKWTNGNGQSGQMHPSKMARPIPETTYRDHAETTAETEAAAAIITVTTDGLLAIRHVAPSPAAAAAALLEDFNIDPSIVPPHTVDPIIARAWMLYTLTQPGLQHPNRYVAQRLRNGAAPPERFVAWARLSPEEWRLLWRAHRYGGPYQETLPADLDLEAWGRTFGDVLPDGPFGDDGRDVADVVSQAIAAVAEAAADAPPRVGVRADGATVWLIPEDEQAADRLRARLPQIAAWLRGRGVLHRLDVATPERLRSGDSRASIWRIALDDLRLQMTQATFDTWLRDSTLLACRDDALVVGVRNTYARDWLENRLYDVIQRTLRRLTGREVEVEFVVVGGAE